MKKENTQEKRLEDYGPIMTKAEVGEFLKLSRNTVTRLIQNGTLKCAKLGEQYRFRKEDVLALFERGGDLECQ